MKKCCFTGHRPDKFSFKYDENHVDAKKFKSTLKDEIRNAILEGYDYFISGMAIGVDLWAARAVLELKSEFPHILLEAAVPCKGQHSRWPKKSQEAYEHIIKQCDSVVMVTENTYDENPVCMNVRNVYMINNSSRIIAVFDGSKGGTKNAFDYAKALGIHITRIDPKKLSVTQTEAKERANSGILECSSIGDPRFSALYAYVEVYGVKQFIEDHYQMSKRFNDEAPKNRWDAKGEAPTHFVVNRKRFGLEYFSMWYKLLWVKYLDEHPELVDYARQFDDFNDHFKGNSINCQADVIREYVKKGRKSIMDECKPLIMLMEKKK